MNEIPSCALDRSLQHCIVVDRISVRFGGSFRTGLQNRTEPNRHSTEIFELLKHLLSLQDYSDLSIFVLHPE
jgi:hypothetical protein